MTQIAHLTTVHARHDTRIRVKEVSTLAGRFGPVALLVQDGKGDAVEDEGRVRIVDAGVPGGRLVRAARGSLRMWRAVRKLRPDIVHFHDPELIALGLLLKLVGIKVIYDVHEDVPQDIMSKDWLPRPVRWPVAKAMAGLEWLAGKAFDGIVVVTPTIARRFPQAKTVLVQNYPVIGELWSSTASRGPRQAPIAVYLGGLTSIRGAREMVEALTLLPDSCEVQLAFAGNISPPGLEAELSTYKGWKRVKAMGWLSRNDVAACLGQAVMGLVLFLPEPNHITAQPNKLFEYMSAGIPVIASDFPLWREIVEGAGCGLLVDPGDPRAIAGAMEWISDHPREAAEMGRRGRRAVERIYNWDREASKLVDLYTALLSPARPRRPVVPTDSTAG